MSVELTSSQETKSVRGKITVTWRAAIANALVSWREFALRSIVVASLASILRMLQGFVVQGFILWTVFAALLFAIHVSENARVQRKASRYAPINEFYKLQERETMMTGMITEAVRAELIRHRIAEHVTGQSLTCKCGAVVEYSSNEDPNSAFGAHISREAWKNVDLPLVESAEALANLEPGSIVINEKGEALAPKTENPGADNDEEIFATRGPLRILAGGPKIQTV